ncbi:MAG: hypothetical protein K2R98_01680 [Gemmataceae bacterium]|nr:hypothetical protein [Gemmataceae bacterium]
MAPQNLSGRPQAFSSGTLYSAAFRALAPESISAQLREKGFFTFEGAIDNELVNSIVAEATTRPLGFNQNDVAPVRYFRQMFFAHILASSPTVVRLLTDPFVLRICAAYLGNEFRLKCQRYYESGFGYQLGWHTDNKTVDNKKTNVKGIVFIIYLTDTYDGELQVVSGSKSLSAKKRLKLGVSWNCDHA